MVPIFLVQRGGLTYSVGLEGEVGKEDGGVEVERRPLRRLARNPQLLHRDLEGTTGSRKDSFSFLDFTAVRGCWVAETSSLETAKDIAVLYPPLVRVANTLAAEVRG